VVEKNNTFFIIFVSETMSLPNCSNLYYSFHYVTERIFSIKPKFQKHKQEKKEKTSTKNSNKIHNELHMCTMQIYERCSYTHLSLLLPLQCCKEIPFQEIDKVTAYYNELFEHLKKQDSTTLLFQRRQDKLKELNSDTLQTPVCGEEPLVSSNDTTAYVPTARNA